MTYNINYFKGKDPLKKREEVLCKLIDEVDKKSFMLFSEICDMDKDSYYKISDLEYQVKDLISFFETLKKAHEYLQSVEGRYSIFVGLKASAKLTLIAGASIGLIFYTPPLGIYAMIKLSSNVIKDYSEEHTEILNRYFRYDNGELERIDNTLANCLTFLKGKQKRLIANFKTKDSDEKNLIIGANENIRLFLASPESSERRYEVLSDTLKDKILSILQTDLGQSNPNFNKLINDARVKKDNNNVLVRRRKLDHRV